MRVYGFGGLESGGLGARDVGIRVYGVWGLEGRFQG